MQYWLQTIFCSTQILNFDCLDDLENTSNTLKACEKKEIYQKSQASTEIENKYLDENPPESILLNDLTNFINESLNIENTNVDNDLNNFLFTITSESEFFLNNRTHPAFITNECENQSCTINQLINDTTIFEDHYSNQNDEIYNFATNLFYNNNTNLPLHMTQNNLIQGRYVNQENHTFIQANDDVSSLSDRYTNNLRTIRINDSKDDQMNKLFHVYDSSTINSFETNTFSNNAYKNDNSGKDKESGTNTNFNIQENNTSDPLKCERENNYTFLVYQFTVNERRIFDNCKNFEVKFRFFCKTIISNKIPHFIKKLETSNLTDDLKNKLILALASLSSFLVDISKIYINTNQPSMHYFLKLLNITCAKFSHYADVSKNFLILDLIYNEFLLVSNRSLHFSYYDFNKIKQMLIGINKRFNYFSKQLFILKESMEISFIN